MRATRLSWLWLPRPSGLLSLALWAAIALVAITRPAPAAENAAAKLGQPGAKAPSYTLQDFRGAEHPLAKVTEKWVVVTFLGIECPLAKMYGKRLVDMSAKYGPQGVAFVAINANQQDTPSEIAQFAKHHNIQFPLLKDVGNKVADQFGAQRTPETFVLDAERVIRYRGRIDDQYLVGLQRQQPTRHDLAEALDELLAGKPVSVPQTEAVGCHIGRVPKPSVADKDSITYSKHIAPILQLRCAECHRPGEVAPFSLLTYDDAVGWAETIDEVVQAKRMPPWHADPRYGKFANSAQITDGERALIRQWVEGGSPEGDRRDLPPPRTFLEGWRIPTPDLVVYMSDKPYQVPAAGEVKYQYFAVDPGFTEDRWIKAAECRPGNRGVVHHIIIHIQPPGVQRRLARGGTSTGGGLESDWLTATAPGASPLILPEGMAKRIPAGSRLVFQMHYTPNGSPQTDRSSLGLVFADPKTVKQEVATDKAGTHQFAIPPGAADHPVEASKTFGREMLLLAMFPHMHLRGKAFRYEARYPNGETEILLDVPHYDFNWQNSYILSEPKRLPAGTRLKCIARYDNSDKNLANPDPKATVRWGDQTWEEMMIGYCDVALADQDLTKEPAKGASPRTAEFKARAEKDGVKLDDELRKLAAAALDSDAATITLGLALRKRVPQLDRVCVTRIAGGKLSVDRVVQEDDLRKLVGGKGVSVNATGLALAKIAEGKEPVVFDNLVSQKSSELEFMARGLASSLHVPAKLGSDPCTVNFWSDEVAAFPPQAKELLQAVAAEMVQGR